MTIKRYRTFVAFVGGNTSQPMGYGRTRASAERSARAQSRKAFPGEPVGKVLVQESVFEADDRTHRWLWGYGWTPAHGTLLKSRANPSPKRRPSAKRRTVKRGTRRAPKRTSKRRTVRARTRR